MLNFFGAPAEEVLHIGERGGGRAGCAIGRYRDQLQRDLAVSVAGGSALCAVTARCGSAS